MGQVFGVFTIYPLVMGFNGMSIPDKIASGQKQVIHLKKMKIEPSDVVNLAQIQIQPYKGSVGIDINGITAPLNRCFHAAHVIYVNVLINKIKQFWASFKSALHFFRAFLIARTFSQNTVKYFWTHMKDAVVSMSSPSLFKYFYNHYRKNAQGICQDVVKVKGAGGDCIFLNVA